MTWSVPAALPHTHATARPRERSRHTLKSTIPRRGEAFPYRPDPITAARIQDLEQRLERHADGEEQLLSVLQELRAELQASTEQNRYGVAAAEREIGDLHAKIQGSRQATASLRAQHERFEAEVRDEERKVYEAELETGALQRRYDEKRLEEAAAETALANLSIASVMAERDYEQQLRDNALLESSLHAKYAANELWQRRRAALRAELLLSSSVDGPTSQRAGSTERPKTWSNLEGLRRLKARLAEELDEKEEDEEADGGLLSSRQEAQRLTDEEAANLASLFRGFSGITAHLRSQRCSIEREIVRRRTFLLAKRTCRRWHEITSSLRLEDLDRRSINVHSREPRRGEAAFRSTPCSLPEVPVEPTSFLDAYLPAASSTARLNQFGLSPMQTEPSDLSGEGRYPHSAAPQKRPAFAAQHCRGSSFLLLLSFSAWCLSIVALPTALLAGEEGTSREAIFSALSSFLSLRFAPLFASSLTPIFAHRGRELAKLFWNIRKRRVCLLRRTRLRRFFREWRTWTLRSGSLEAQAVRHFGKSAARRAFAPIREVLGKRRLRAGLRALWLRGCKVAGQTALAAWSVVARRGIDRGLKLSTFTQRRRSSRRLGLLGRAFESFLEFFASARRCKEILCSRRTDDLQEVGLEVFRSWRLGAASMGLERRVRGHEQRLLLIKSFRGWVARLGLVDADFQLTGRGTRVHREFGIAQKVLSWWRSYQLARAKEREGANKVRSRHLHQERLRCLSLWRTAHRRRTIDLRDALRKALAEASSLQLEPTVPTRCPVGGTEGEELPRAAPQPDMPLNPSVGSQQAAWASVSVSAFPSSAPPPPNPPLEFPPRSILPGECAAAQLPALGSPPMLLEEAASDSTSAVALAAAAPAGEVAASNELVQRHVTFQQQQQQQQQLGQQLRRQQNGSLGVGSQQLLDPRAQAGSGKEPRPDLPPPDPPLKNPPSPAGSSSSADQEGRAGSRSSHSSNENKSRSKSDLQAQRVQLLDRMQTEIRRLASATSHIEAAKEERSGVLLTLTSKERAARDELRERLIPEAEEKSRQSLLHVDARVSSMQEELSVIFDEQRALRASLRASIGEAGEDRQALQAATSEQSELEHCLKESARICTEAAEARRKQIDSLEVYLRKCRGQLVSLEEALEDALQEHAEIRHLQEQAGPQNLGQRQEDALQGTLNLMPSPVVPDVLLAT